MEIIALTLAVLVVAILYSSVGHAGASGYIAVLALAGVAPVVIKPLALMLNIVVAAIASWQYWRAGYFSPRLLSQFALLSIPAAFAGGYLQLPGHIFERLVGAVLIFSAARLVMHPIEVSEPRPPGTATALAAGGALGFLAGLTGTGGGIFLTPLLLFRRWAAVRTAAAVSAVFILLNSSAGLAGHLSGGGRMPAPAVPLVIAAVTGGLIGSRLGSRRLQVRWILWILALVLLLAGSKLLFALR